MKVQNITFIFLIGIMLLGVVVISVLANRQPTADATSDFQRQSEFASAPDSLGAADQAGIALSADDNSRIFWARISSPDGLAYFWRTLGAAGFSLPNPPGGYHYAYDPGILSFWDVYAFRDGGVPVQIDEELEMSVCFDPPSAGGPFTIAQYTGTPRVWSILVTGDADPLCASVTTLGQFALLEPVQ